MRLSGLTVALLILTATPVVALGDRPPEKPAYLRRVSSHVCAGVVVSRNPKVEKSSRWRTTHYSVELAVTSVLKGTEIGLLDRIHIESDYREWTGQPNEMPTGWNGVGAPSVNAKVLVYLTGGKSTGFRFVEPNGFIDVETLRENSGLLQSHLSNEEWESIERAIGNVALVKDDSTVNIFSLTVLCLFVAVTIIAFTFRYMKPKRKKTIRTTAG